MRRLCILTVLALAGCGVNGAPERPTATGLSISGEATVGIAKNGS